MKAAQTGSPPDVPRGLGIRFHCDTAWEQFVTGASDHSYLMVPFSNVKSISPKSIYLDANINHEVLSRARNIQFPQERIRTTLRLFPGNEALTAIDMTPMKVIYNFHIHSFNFPDRRAARPLKQGLALPLNNFLYCVTNSTNFHLNNLDESRTN